MVRRFALIALLLTLCSLPAVAQVNSVPSLMNFQGRLSKPDGTPVPNGNYSIRFSLHDALTGGTEKWNQTLNPVAVRNGTFAVLLSGFPAGTFNSDLWLGIQIGTDAELTPRQPLVTVAYAFKANSVADGAVGTNSLANRAVTGAKIANGTITADKFATNLLNPLAWLLGGNSGTNPANHFLGTTDNNPLEFRVNNQRVLRFARVEFNNLLSVNALAGWEGNSIMEGVTVATIAGGGELVTSTNTSLPNRVTDVGGTVSGGAGNTAGNADTTPNNANFATVSGGIFNTAHSILDTVAGGQQNTASGGVSTVSGGLDNMASGVYATVAGGNANTASGVVSAVSGGVDNTASGAYATVAGGSENSATGAFSFAAGRQAKSNHNGSFVWADRVDADFASTAANQFLVRASGGMGVNASSLRGDLDLRSASGNANFYMQAGGAASGVNFGVSSSGNLFIAHYDGATYTDRIYLSTVGNVGIGTNSPTHKLHVNGSVAGVGAYNNLSDARYKTQVQTFPDALDAILNLRGVTFDWRQADYPDLNFTPGKQVGFIAQEVEKVLPELVTTDNKGYKSVAYANVVPVLVEAVKTLKKENEATKRENAELKAVLADVLKRLEQVERRSK